MSDAPLLRWTWLQAVADSDLPSTTRLVLHTLALHMTKIGENCYPGATLLARESGLDRRTVQRSLASVDGTWITRERELRPNGSWGRTTYLPRLPDAHVAAQDRHASEDVAAQDRHPEADGAHVAAQDRGVAAQDRQGSGAVPPPRSGAVPPETVETFRETSVETLSEGEADASSPVESMKANELVAEWIKRQPARPPTAAVKKQGAAAKRLVKDYTRSDLDSALDGIGRMYPFSDGTPWDLFTLEKKMGVAGNAPAQNGTRRGRPTEVDPNDIEAWR